jgi:hypothetical protein
MVQGLNSVVGLVVCCVLFVLFVVVVVVMIVMLLQLTIELDHRTKVYTMVPEQAQVLLCGDKSEQIRNPQKSKVG